MAALLSLALLPGCSRTLSQSTILNARSGPRQELRDDIVRHNVALASAASCRLAGWHLQTPGATRLVLFFGSNTATLLDNSESLWRLADALRADVVAFDYRGYGFSTGVPSLAAMIEDASRLSAFARGLAEQRGGLPITVVGQSLGTFPAARAAAHASWVDQLVLLAPAPSMSELVQAVGHTLPWYRHAVMGDSLARLNIDSSADLATTESSTLLVRGDRDALTHVSGTEQLLRASAAARKHLCQAKGTYDDMTVTNPSVLRCITDFLQPVQRQPRADFRRTARR